MQCWNSELRRVGPAVSQGPGQAGSQGLGQCWVAGGNRIDVKVAVFRADSSRVCWAGPQGVCRVAVITQVPCPGTHTGICDR